MQLGNLRQVPDVNDKRVTCRWRSDAGLAFQSAFHILDRERALPTDHDAVLLLPGPVLRLDERDALWKRLPAMAALRMGSFAEAV